MVNQVSENKGPGLRDYWRILVEGRWYIIVSFVVVLASTAFFTFTANPVYEASGRILVLTNRGNAFGEDISTFNMPTSLSGNIRNEVPNWVEMMTSRAALEKAVSELNSDPQFVEAVKTQNERLSLLDRLFGRSSQAQQTNQNSSTNSTNDDPSPSLSVKDLKGRISVANVSGTDLIEVKASGGSPLEAELITNALLSSYLELDTDITKSTLVSVKDFLGVQLKKTFATLTAAEEEFALFRHENSLELGFTSLEQLITQLEQRKVELDLDLTETQANLKAVTEQLEEVKKDLFDSEISLQDSTKSPKSSDEVIIANLQQLRKKIEDLEERRVQYLASEDYNKAQGLLSEIFYYKSGIDGLSRGRFAPFAFLSSYESLLSQQTNLYAAIPPLQDRIKVIQERIASETERLASYRLQYQRFERDIKVNEDIYTMLSEEYEKARIADVGELGGIRMVSAAVEPDSPIKPKKKVNLILGALVGLTVGTGFAFLKEYLDNTYKTPKEVEKDLGIPSLGTVFAVEHKRRRNGGRAQEIRQTLITRLDAKDPFVNAHIGIEASLRFASVDKPLRTFMVTSAFAQEGKSSLVANLGLIFSHMGRQTVIVDSDLRKPIFHRLFGIDRKGGLTDVALGEIELEEALIRPYARSEGRFTGRGLSDLLVSLGKISQGDLEEALKVNRHERLEQSLERVLINTGKLKQADLDEVVAQQSQGLESFHILQPGPQPLNPTDFLGSERMKVLIKQLQERFEVVLFDSPPVLSVPDATVLSSQVDGVILLIKAESTDKGAVQQAVEKLSKAGANIIGVVLNGVKKSTSRYYGGYYGYYYGYYGYGGEDKESD